MTKLNQHVTGGRSMPYQHWLPAGALLGVVAVSLLVLDSSTASAGTLRPLWPGGPLAVDRPGPVLPELHTLALPAPLGKEYVTCLLSETTWGRAGDADTCAGTGKTSLLASGRRQDPLMEFLGWLCCINSSPVCSDRMRFEKLTCRERGHLSPTDAWCAAEVKGSDEIPPSSRARQGRKMRTEPPWMTRNNTAA